MYVPKQSSYVLDKTRKRFGTKDASTVVTTEKRMLGSGLWTSDFSLAAWGMSYSSQRKPKKTKNKTKYKRGW